MNILIYNKVDFHYEVIESVIHFFCNISRDHIQLVCCNNPSFEQYMKKKYKKLQITNDLYVDLSLYDKVVNCTVYPDELDLLEKYYNSNKFFFISHCVDDRLVQYNNIYFITPLCNTPRYFYANKLPYTHIKRKTTYPIFIIQGSFVKERRDIELLNNLLEVDIGYKYIIKIIGKYIDNQEKLMEYSDRLIIKQKLDFENYHKEFVNCYCLIPLISKEKTPRYYTNTLTSSISYAKAYNLNILLDKELNDIYNMKNAYIYKNKEDITSKFKKCIYDFYHTPLK